MEGESDGGRFPWWLGAVGALFLLLAGGLVTASLRGPAPRSFAPVPAGATAVPDSGRCRATLDARDPERWVYLDLSTGRVHASAAEGWDLAARRFHVIANGGPALPGDAAVAIAGAPAGGGAPGPDRRGWTVTRRTEDGELRHSLLESWYAYDFFSHTLAPRPRTYVMRTTGGRLAEIRFLSYYCPGPEAGCVTVRYAFVDAARGAGRAVAASARNGRCGP